MHSQNVSYFTSTIEAKVGLPQRFSAGRKSTVDDLCSRLYSTRSRAIYKGADVKAWCIQTFKIACNYHVECGLINEGDFLAFPFLIICDPCHFIPHYNILSKGYSFDELRFLPNPESRQYHTFWCLGVESIESMYAGTYVYACWCTEYSSPMYFDEQWCLTVRLSSLINITDSF